MNSNQFRRYLPSRGCTFEVNIGKGGHIKVMLGTRRSFLPSHGGAKQLKTGLMRAIKKDLGIVD